MRLTFKDFRMLVKSDMDRYAQIHKEKLSFYKTVSLFFLPCMQAIFLYRLSNYLFMRKIKFLPRLLYVLNIIVYSAEIFPATEIGSHFYMPHAAGIMLYGKIGNYCSVFAHGFVGGRELGSLCSIEDFPVVGDGVSLGCRASILGPVKVGSGSTIGAHALVLDDVPENAVVVGIPAKVIRIKTDKNE